MAETHDGNCNCFDCVVGPAPEPTVIKYPVDLQLLEQALTDPINPFYLHSRTDSMIYQAARAYLYMMLQEQQ